MDESYEDKIQRLHDMEQAETMMSSVAATLGGYYKALIAAGIPPDLAGQMLLEMQGTMARFHQTDE